MRHVWTWLVLLVGLGLGAVAVLVAADGVREFSDVRASGSLPRVEGTVVTSVVAQGAKGRPRLDLEYTYEVDGRVLSSTRIESLTALGRRRSAARAHELAARYPVGATVAVAYDPSDPARALLETGSYDGALRTLVGAAVFLGIGAVLVRRSLRRGLRLRRTFRFPALNFELRAPPGWTVRRRKGDAAPALTLERGELTLSLVGLASTGNWLSSPETVVSERVGIVRDVAESVRVVRREPYEAGGLAGVLFVVEAVESGVELLYVGFGSGHRGFEYEVLLYGPRGHLKGGSEPDGRGVALLTEILEGYRVQDLERSAYGDRAPFDPPWVSPDYGYRFAPAGTGWRQWASVATDFEETELGLLHACGGVLTAMPVTLPDAELPFDAVCAGLVALYGALPRDAGLVRTGGDEAVERPHRVYRYARRAGENEDAYRMHAVRWGDVAFLLTFSTEPDNPALEPVFEDALAGLEPPPPGRAAPAPEELDARGRKRHVTALRGVARWLRDARRTTEAAAVFERLLALAPDDAGALHELLLSYTHRGAWTRAMEALREHGGRFASNLAIASFEPYLLKRMGRAGDARAAYERLFEQGWREAGDEADYVDLLLGERCFDEARQRVEAWMLEGDTPALRALLARVHRECGDHDAAVAAFRLAVERDPSDVGARVALAHELVHAELYEEAIGACDELEERGLATADAYFARGVAQARLEWYQQARASLEASVRLDPSNETVRGWLDHVTSQLGQGDHRLLRRSIEPVALPADGEPSREVRERFADAAAVHLDHLHAFAFERGDGVRVTTRHRIRIQSERGVSRWSTFRVPFDAENEELYVNELRVRDADGATVTVGRLEDWYVRDHESDSADSRKVAHLPVPGLVEGALLELTYTRRLAGDRGRFPYRRIGLGLDQPVLRSVVDVRGDLDGVRWRTAGEVEERTGDGRLRFTARAVPGFESEPYAEPEHRWRPTVWLCEPRASWAEVVTRYLERIEDRLEPDPRAAELARELTDGIDEPEARAVALADWVRREVGYKSIAFGPRASIPDPPERVIEARFSDCKGHALLFLQLMRAVGQRCELALVDTGGDSWAEASEWQFDHMINYCPDLGGGRFVDCVDKGLGLGAEVPNGLGGGAALVLDAAAPELRRIPEYAEGANRVACARTVRCAPDGSLDVDERLTLTQNLASYMRAWLRRHDPEERRERLERILAVQESGLEVTRLAVEALDDYERPLVLDLAYRVRHAWEEVDGHLAGRPCAPWEHEYLLPDGAPARQSPFRIRMPFAVESEVRLEPPAGRRLESAEPAAEDGSDAMLSWQRSYERDGDALVVRFAAGQKRGHHPADAWDAFRASSRRALDALRLRVVVEPRDEVSAGAVG